MSKFATLSQISELDRLAMEEFGLDILQMMEMAGNKSALVIKDYLKDLNHKKILVLAGIGNNGGDGLCSARYLVNWGASVKVILVRSDLRPAAAHQLSILKKMEVEPLIAPAKLPKADLIVDALLGYNQKGDAKFPYSDLIEQANQLNLPIIAFDNPSGLNIETGQPTKYTIKAAVTVTLAVIKQGLKTPQAKDYVGKLYLVDLGIPKKAYEMVNLDYPFNNSSKALLL